MICLVSVSSTEMYAGDQNRDSRDPSLEVGQAAEGKHWKGSGSALGDPGKLVRPRVWLLSLVPQYACSSLQHASSESFLSEPGHVGGLHPPTPSFSPDPPLLDGTA